MVPGSHRKTIVQNDAENERGRSERLSSLNSTTTTTPPPSPISSIPTSTTSSNNPISHNDGGNSDILAELNRWNAIFSNPDTDPKTVLIRELGYTREAAKAALNQTINGSRQYKRFVAWFKEQFPLLHGVWERTDMATVGNEISSFYETQLMQDMELYELAERLGLHLSYEYDGCGVMCREDDREAVSKIQQLVSHVQAKSEKMWGIRPVLVVKTALGEPVNNQPVAAEIKVSKGKRSTTTVKRTDALMPTLKPLPLDCHPNP